MAPKKRKTREGDDIGPSSKKPVTRQATSSLRRVTRSLTRSGGPNLVELPTDSTKRKKAKTTPQKSENATEEEKAAKEKGKEKVEETTEEEKAGDEGVPKKTIVIEHCKQCSSFKKRATEVQNGLEDAVPGINVVLNPDKPRRGCFEIREEGGETFISLLDMKRPFQPMKDLDMEKVVGDIVGKIK